MQQKKRRRESSISLFTLPIIQALSSLRFASLIHSSSSSIRQVRTRTVFGRERDMRLKRIFFTPIFVVFRSKQTMRRRSWTSSTSLTPRHDNSEGKIPIFDHFLKLTNEMCRIDRFHDTLLRRGCVKNILFLNELLKGREQPH